MSLEQSLKDQEEQVDALLRSANKYLGTLKAWKKACGIGHINDMLKSSSLAEELVLALPDSALQAKKSWTFDVTDYLATDAWRKELQETASSQFSLRTLEDDTNLISSPVVVRTLPNRNSMAIGKVNWSAIRPKVVAKELKRLRDRAASANSQEFIESLSLACIHLHGKGVVDVKFRDIYDMYCLTPGYKKENPPAAFGQQIYALHRSDVRTTKGNKKIEIEYATGSFKANDIFSVVAEDGRTIRYFTLYFK